MARVVRKVSNKATKGQKRDKGALLHSKKFWIIVISVLVVLIAAGITIGVIVANNNKKSDSTVEVDDYFGQTQKFQDTDINFTKMTYQGVRLHTNPEESELFNDFTFIFATNLNAFYPEELLNSDDVDLRDSKHAEIFENLKQLQYEIDRYNASEDPEYKIALYIVNTDQVDGNTSYNIYSDSTLCKASSDSLGPLFSVVGEDGVLDTVNAKSIYASDFYENNAMVSAIVVAKNLVKDRNFDQIAYVENN